MDIFEPFSPIPFRVIKEILLQSVIALKARCWTHSHLTYTTLIYCFHSLNVHLAVSMGGSFYWIVEVFPIKTNIWYMFRHIR